MIYATKLWKISLNLICFEKWLFLNFKVRLGVLEPCKSLRGWGRVNSTTVIVLPPPWSRGFESLPQLWPSRGCRSPFVALTTVLISDRHPLPIKNQKQIVIRDKSCFEQWQGLLMKLRAPCTLQMAWATIQIPWRALGHGNGTISAGPPWMSSWPLPLRGFMWWVTTHQFESHYSTEYLTLTYAWSSLPIGSGEQMISQRNLPDITYLLIEKFLISTWGSQVSSVHNQKTIIRDWIRIKESVEFFQNIFT